MAENIDQEWENIERYFDQMCEDDGLMINGKARRAILWFFKTYVYKK